jgi:hypothetical protein
LGSQPLCSPPPHRVPGLRRRMHFSCFPVRMVSSPRNPNVIARNPIATCNCDIASRVSYPRSVKEATGGTRRPQERQGGHRRDDEATGETRRPQERQGGHRRDKEVTGPRSKRRIVILK